MAELPDRLGVLSLAVDDALRHHLEVAGPRLVALHPSLEPLATELTEYVLQGGKRLRPALLLLGHELAGGTAPDVLGPAVAVELLHTCALLHDDVIDDAATRRGRPATHVGFAVRHRARGGVGDADDYGAAMAILLGDLAFTQADEAMLAAEIDPSVLLAGMAAFTRLREEVMAGQALDVQAAADGESDRELALTIATLKSGRYSVTRPLQLGAVLASAPGVLVDALASVGDPLGRAFQLRDDLLGVFGVASETGKSVSGDLAEGKRTLLVAEAMARLDDRGRAELNAGLGRRDLDERTSDRLRDLLESCGARAAAEAQVAAEAAAARAAIDEVVAAGGDTDAVAVLRSLASWMTERTA